MSNLQVELDAEGYCLDLTMRPSFISCLYVRVGEATWVKRFGFLRGLELKQMRERLVVSYPGRVDEESLTEEGLLESGLWYNLDVSAIEDGHLRAVARELSSVYRGVGIAISPRDFNYLLIATTLSKRTSYRGLVLRWCERIFEKFDGELSGIASARSLSYVGTSYQLRQLTLTVKDAVAKGINEGVVNLELEVARRRLMECWGIGPKVADALILFSTKKTAVLPCDTHLKTFAARLGVLKDTQAPAKRYCLKYACSKTDAFKLNTKPCPKANVCLRAALVSKLKGASGWFQTVVYLHGGNYCKLTSPSCHRCPLQGLCKFGAMGV